ncbi:hypothetical protein FB451DRAFT_1185010 [Mycena latifolia]|nr:hypothetical protein FB451DRAFT_1185010 [Mycena latifolia]
MRLRVLAERISRIFARGWAENVYPCCEKFLVYMYIGAEQSSRKSSCVNQEQPPSILTPQRTNDTSTRALVVDWHRGDVGPGSDRDGPGSLENELAAGSGFVREHGGNFSGGGVVARGEDI